MKYRGSTKGAVISESAVERMKISTKEVFGPSFCVADLAVTSLDCDATGAIGFESVRYDR